MIVTLNIRNFALIEKLTLDLSPGLNVFTGETGAGKSLIIQAFSMILGERAQSSIVRQGCQEASIEALFDTGSVDLQSRLNGLGLESEDLDGSLLISRQVNSAGKGSKCFVNGKMTVLSSLKGLGNDLVDLHGQHDHQALMKSSRHLAILDDFAGDKIRRNLSETADAVSSLRELVREVKSLRSLARERTIARDNYLFQMNEIDLVSPHKDEDATLESRHRILANSDRLKHLATKVEYILSGDDGAVDNLRKGLKDLEEICQFTNDGKEAFTNYQEAVFLLEEAGSSLLSIASSVEYDEEELASIEDRLGQIHSLVRKYGPTLDEVLSYRAEIGEKLAALEQSVELLTHSDERISAQKNTVSALALKLSRKRKKISEELTESVNRELAFLEMKDAIFNVNLWQKESEESDDTVVVDGRHIQLTGTGIDRCEFEVATNKGEKSGPLSKVASGGEVSRVMLAIKSALASSDSVPIMVFDEIDTGIGGETGWSVARKLYEVSRNCQCLCITHLPQIAAYADAHYNVSKSGDGERTVIEVSPLDEEGRVLELARMLGGDTASARAHASEFLSNARNGVRKP